MPAQRTIPASNAGFNPHPYHRAVSAPLPDRPYHHLSDNFLQPVEEISMTVKTLKLLQRMDRGLAKSISKINKNTTSIERKLDIVEEQVVIYEDLIQEQMAKLRYMDQKLNEVLEKLRDYQDTDVESDDVYESHISPRFYPTVLEEGIDADDEYEFEDEQRFEEVTPTPEPLAENDDLEYASEYGTPPVADQYQLSTNARFVLERLGLYQERLHLDVPVYEEDSEDPVNNENVAEEADTEIEEIDGETFYRAFD
jgi:hypothetical protein